MRKRHYYPLIALISAVGALAGSQIVDIADPTEVVVQCPTGYELQSSATADRVSAKCVKSPDGSTSSLRVRVR